MFPTLVFSGIVAEMSYTFDWEYSQIWLHSFRMWLFFIQTFCSTLNVTRTHICWDKTIDNVFLPDSIPCLSIVTLIKDKKTKVFFCFFLSLGKTEADHSAGSWAPLWNCTRCHNSWRSPCTLWRNPWRYISPTQQTRTVSAASSLLQFDSKTCTLNQV